uniref:Uncharacterized protein n=1 Tax=Tanacetum cinerariifolium TaxID=118510 RepID=A0A6L2KH71_TANCI|nr:hypothetical protein [Tanacetum cinerariifolium]
MKAHPKHIDWGKLTVTQEIMDGYVMPQYGKTNWMEDYSWIDIVLDDIYDTFYRDEEEKAKVAKASKDMKLSIMKEKFLAMVESENAIVKDYTKLVVTDEMVDYVLEKYENTWKCEDEISSVILEDLWLNYGKGSLEVDFPREIKAKEVDDHDDDNLDSLDLANRIKKLEEDFGRLLKAKKAKEAKKANDEMMMKIPLPPLQQDPELSLPLLPQDPKLPLSILPRDPELPLHPLLMHKLLPLLQEGTKNSYDRMCTCFVCS